MLGLGRAANDTHLLQLRSAGREIMEQSGIRTCVYAGVSVPCLFTNSSPACTGSFMRRA